jgi:hypothetical protein
VVTTVLQFLYSHLQKLSQWLQFPFRCFGEIRFQVSDTIKMETDGITFHRLWIHRKKWYLLQFNWKQSNWKNYLNACYSMLTKVDG